MDSTNLSEMNRIWLNAMQDMFRSSMSAMSNLQEEVVRMAKVTGGKNMEAWQLNQGMVDEWISTFRKGQEDLRKMVDETFQKAQTNLDNLRKATETTGSTKATPK